MLAETIMFNLVNTFARNSASALNSSELIIVFIAFTFSNSDIEIISGLSVPTTFSMVLYLPFGAAPYLPKTGPICPK